MHRQRNRGNPSDLVRRVLASLVLAPAVLVAIKLGGAYFMIVAATLSGIAAREWVIMLRGPANEFMAWLVGACSMASILVGTLGSWSWAVILICLGGLAAAMGAPPGKEEGTKKLGRIAMGGGVIYGAGGLLALASLHEKAEGGAFLIWLVVVIWSCDSFAYLVGRSFGKHRLAPGISPNKSWEGAVAGGVAGMLTGILFACLIGLRTQEIVIAGVLSLGLAIIGQFGDLLMSWVKRYLGKGDSARLIPGHGGLLDRLDGLLAASWVVFFALRAMDAFHIQAGLHVGRV